MIGASAKRYSGADAAASKVFHRNLVPMIRLQSAADARWRMLALISVAELLGMALWFAGSAVAPQLQARWALSGSEVGGLATAVQLGFVVGTALSAVLNLADIVPSRRLFAASAVCGALANGALLLAPTYGVAIATRAAAEQSCSNGLQPSKFEEWIEGHRSERRGVMETAPFPDARTFKPSPRVWTI